ncbi:hypothetical protein [Pseudonocardia sp. NPDC046786]|uniref:hypothetical protein n=1 Tax=Pseudonocardia sp. NPDC046786 TaxID=3155471 RepID=UPI0033C306E8
MPVSSGRRTGIVLAAVFALVLTAALAADVGSAAGGPATVLLSSGDNVGASPLASALFRDEPTTELLDAMGVAASAAGNHEFDEGRTGSGTSRWARRSPRWTPRRPS